MTAEDVMPKIRAELDRIHELATAVYQATGDRRCVDIAGSVGSIRGLLDVGGLP